MFDLLVVVAVFVGLHVWLRRPRQVNGSARVWVRIGRTLGITDRR